MAKLSLNDIVNIVVNLSPKSVVRKGFNLGLFVGTSEVVPPDERVRLYNNLDDMYEDGFREDMPEYKAASKYFQQTKRPNKVAIGRHVTADGLTEFTVATEEGTEAGQFVINIEPNNLESGNKYVYKTAVSSITLPTYLQTLTSGWIEIANGDEVTAVQGNLILIAEVDSANRALKVGKAVIGGDSIPLNLPKNETVLEAIRACRNKNTDWYIVMYCGASKDDILAISEYIETAVPSSLFGFTSNEKDVFTGSKENIFNLLKDYKRIRTFGQYTETEDAVAAIIGYAMGANTKTSRSAFTLMHKTEVGVLPDDIDETQVYYLKKANANYYVSRGYDGEYSMYENGVMCGEAYFDEILNLDMLVNDMQLAILDLLKSRPKIPQTEAGMNDIKLAVKPSLDKSRLIGFIAPGKWNGPSIWLTNDYCPLETGDMMPDGYMILSEPIDNQTQADRDERKAAPIYTPIKLSGAIHSAIVQIDVNR